MSETRPIIEDLPKPETELTPEQAEDVAGGASDYLLELDGIKGESKVMQKVTPSSNLLLTQGIKLQP